MAKESVKILQGKLDVKSLIDQLNAALSEEWLAYYQYWVGALVVEGAMRADVQGEFEEHAEEERHHAQLIADRIIELEGVPVLDPKKWFELARCKYDSPTAFDSVSLLNQNVSSERCAILRYQEIANFTNGKDYTTCDIAKHILAEEEEHEQDLQDYLTDIARMKESFLKKSILVSSEIERGNTPPEAVSSFYCLSPYNNFSFTPRLYSNIHILYVATVTNQKTMRLMG